VTTPHRSISIKTLIREQGRFCPALVVSVDS
jgi:hypothetical protein